MNPIKKEPCSIESAISLYFMNRVDQENLKTHITHALQYIKRHPHLFNPAKILEMKHFQLDYPTLSTDPFLTPLWPQLAVNLVNDTEFTLNCFASAMFIHLSGPPFLIRARITNFTPIKPLKDININYFGKLVTLRGTVIKASPVKITCDYMAFSCKSCGIEKVEKLIDGAYKPLDKCPSCKTKGLMEANYRSEKTRTVEWQSVVLQEAECDMAKIPQTLECEVTEDLVKTCLPGDDITITGVIQARDPNDNKGKNKQNTLFTLFMQTVSLFNNNSDTCHFSSNFSKMTFTDQDLEEIQSLQNQPQLFRQLVHSLCPSIYGHEVVKAGLLLALFRGSKVEDSRGESHVLVVGDPGLGKSQMLKSCANVSPRGVYVCGNVSTTSGLTVTMTRESGGEYSLEAGALLIADQGCCCIDEFDKMPHQHACLLEAMEQQCISIAKAGVVCSLPTKPTILVAANPAGGHYNKSKTVAENLKIGSPMLSRFDLIFILLDQPNEHLDKYLSRHILTSHSSKKRRYAPKQFHDDEEVGEVETLRDRLKLTDDFSPTPHKQLRKYLAYAQKFVNPSLSVSSKRMLTDFYVTLRQQFANGDSTPVTARQLHSLIRLTQARAKLELRHVADDNDARDVIDIMKHSLVDVFTDEAGILDKTRLPMGSGMSYKNQVMKLVELLQRRSEIETKSLFTVQEIKGCAESAGILKTKFSQALESLNIQGFLLKKGHGTYQLNSAYL